MTRPGIPAPVIKACLRVLNDTPSDTGICLCRDIACPKHPGALGCGTTFPLVSTTHRINPCCAGAPYAWGFKEVAQARESA